MLKVGFYGGIKRVTGSNILIEDGSNNIILDCGLIQGKNTCELENFQPFPYDPSKIDCVFVSHAHLDHIGRIPKLFREGFRGKIYSTSPTKDLAKEILLDSLKVIRENCISMEKEIFYSEDDLEKVFAHWYTVKYQEPVKIGNFIINFHNAGHILGSAFVQVFHQLESTRLIYSGDLGNSPNPLLPDLDLLPETDYLILESTYGDKDHENLTERKDVLEDVLEDVIYHKKTLIIPSFALERTQELVSEILTLIEKRKIPSIRIYLDSPLAKRLSDIYYKYPDYLNNEAQKFIWQRVFEKEEIKIVYEMKDEYQMFESEPPKVIISSSGMLTGGRMINILQRYLEDPSAILLFVGYQAEGSLGREILNGAKEVFVEDKKYQVRLEIKTLFSYSNHIDQSGILKWIRPQRYILKEIFLFHGDQIAKEVLRHRIMDALGVRASIAEEKVYQL